MKLRKNGQHFSLFYLAISWSVRSVATADMLVTVAINYWYHLHHPRRSPHNSLDSSDSGSGSGKSLKLLEDSDGICLARASDDCRTFWLSKSLQVNDFFSFWKTFECTIYLHRIAFGLARDLAAWCTTSQVFPMID